MGKRSNFERIPRDLYPTPVKAVQPLIPYLRAAGIRSFAEPDRGGRMQCKPPTRAPSSCSRAPHSNCAPPRRSTSRALSSGHGELQMSKDEKKIDPLADDTPDESPATESAIPPEVAAELDEEEKEFRALRRDLPGVKGSSAAGIVTFSVGKTPRRMNFFAPIPTSDRSCRS
jgi:hypothetical protein